MSASRVFESEAYMLFYLRCKEKKTSVSIEIEYLIILTIQLFCNLIII